MNPFYWFELDVAEQGERVAVGLVVDNTGDRLGPVRRRGSVTHEPPVRLHRGDWRSAWGKP